MLSINSIKYLLMSKFDNLYIKDIKLLSTSGEYITCLINDEYLFNIILNPNNKDYDKEKTNLDFLREKLNTNLSLPNIEYSFVSDDIVIKGYKKINGVPLNTNIIRLMPKDKQNDLASNIASFLKQLHNIPVKEQAIDLKYMIKEDIEYIKNSIYYLLNNNEKRYISKLLDLLDSIPELTNETCLSHCSLKYSKFIIDKNSNLVGIVGFDELGVAPIYTDFLPLLDDIEIGKKIIGYYNNIDFETLLTIKNIMDIYLPIKQIVYGLKNNRNDIVERARRQIDITIKEF